MAGGEDVRRPDGEHLAISIRFYANISRYSFFFGFSSQDDEDRTCIKLHMPRR